MPISTFQFLSIYLHYGLVELHSAIVRHQERHAQYGILVDTTDHEDFFHLHISHSERQSQHTIKWQPLSIDHDVVRVALFQTILLRY